LSVAVDLRLVLACAAVLLACGVGGEPETATAGAAAPAAPRALWVDATSILLPATEEWTNRVEVVDLNGDGLLDLLFANGGDYSAPGEPELNRVFLNRGPGERFVEATTEVLGTTPDWARVIKVRDVTGDGLPDILVGTTFQSQSRLFVSTAPGQFREATRTHLPRQVASVGDLELGDVDGDGDLDVVLADWGAGDNMRNEGGRTRLWLNDGAGRFSDATDQRMPAERVRFSWDVELVDVDNDWDLDVLVSCKRCGGGSIFRNEGSGRFGESGELVLPQYTNNYDYEAMDLDGDGFLDLASINDGEIVGGESLSRRETVLRNHGGEGFVDATHEWWPDEANIGEDDNNIAFLDFDSDGDADFLVASLTGPDRLLINDGSGRLSLAADVFEGTDTAGTLSLVLADLDGDHRLDVVQGQGENPDAVEERIFLGSGLAPDSAPPSVGPVDAELQPDGSLLVRARVHDRKSPSMPGDWRSVDLVRSGGAGEDRQPMAWYGEHLWRARLEPAACGDSRVCAVDAAGNEACVPCPVAAARAASDGGS
jgi:hypothetical protein